MREMLLAMIKNLKTQEGKEEEIAKLEKQLADLTALENKAKADAEAKEKADAEIEKLKAEKAKAVADKAESDKLNEEMKEKLKANPGLTLEEVMAEAEAKAKILKDKADADAKLKALEDENKALKDKDQLTQEQMKLAQIKQKITDLKVTKPYYKELLDKIDLTKEGITESEIATKLALIFELHNEEDMKKKYEADKNKGGNPYLTDDERAKLKGKGGDKTDLEKKIEERRAKFLGRIR